MSTPPTTLEGRRASLMIAVLSLAGIVVSLQQTLVIPLVPQLPRLLDASAADTSWAVTATLLAGAVATPMVGRLADMVGKRRMLLVCVAVLVVGSVIAALSTDLALLVVGRALQGLATGVVPLGISLMRDHLPAARLPGGTAQMSASLGVGGALGLPIAALIAQNADWHAVFWVSAGLGAAAFAAVLAVVHESPHRAGGRFDLVGAVGLSVALVCLLLAVSKGGTWGWTSADTLGLFAAAAVVLLVWGAWELRTPQPLVDLRVARRRQVLLTNTASAVFGYSMLTSALVFPQIIQLPAVTGYGLGGTILLAGLLQAPGGLCMMLASPISARITAASGPRTTLMAGAVVVALGYGFSAVWHHAIWELLVGAIVVSSGVGLAYGAMPTLIMDAVPVSQTAAANSFNNLSRAIGTSVASAVAGVLLASMTTTVAGHAFPSEAAFSTILVLGAGTALVALAITAFIPRRVRSAQVSSSECSSTQKCSRPGSAPPADELSGTVRGAGGEPSAGAVLTVVSRDGRELARTRADEQGRYRLHPAPPDVAHLLVVQWRGLPHVERLDDPGVGRRDVTVGAAQGVTTLAGS